jgi:large subunit ribosomal protein L15
MDLSSLRPAPGARKPRKRVGRGPGSGLGKTSGRGHKGRKSRSGGNSPRGYEGGQMPLLRRLPKRGFHNPFRREYAVVNLAALARFEEGAVVDPESLAAAGLGGGRGTPVKILGKGALDRRLTVKAHAFSASAKAAIEAKGGTAEVVA